MAENNNAKKHKRKQVMMKKKLFVVRAGLGNQIQQTEIYLDLIGHYGKVDVAVYEEKKELSEYFRQIAEHTDNLCIWFNCRKGKPIFWTDGVYDGVISCLNITYEGIPVIYQSSGTHAGNEVDWYEKIYEVIPMRKNNLIPIDWEKIRNSKNEGQRNCDVIICNGSVNKYNWIRKRYQNWDKVAQALNEAGYKVGCVGMPDEYIYGAEDLTKLSLMDTFDIISNCKLFLSNDSGLYHFANVIGKKNIVLFTATRIEKNYNENFHRSAVVFRPEIECFPCQESTWGQGREWKKCCNWICSEYDYKKIVQVAKKMLKGSKVKKEYKVEVERRNDIQSFRPIAKNKISKEEETRLIIDAVMSVKKKQKPETWKYIPEALIDKMWLEKNKYHVKMKDGTVWKWDKSKERV